MARPALAATRALEIISYLTEHADESFTMAQLTRALRLNQGSAHAILRALVDDGFLVRHRVHKTYRLGPALVAVGDAATRANPIIGIAREELGSLADELGLEALASMRTGAELRVVVRVGRHTSRGPARRVGQHYPLVPPLGAALVAWSPPEVQQEWISATPVLSPDDDSSTVTPDELAALLADVRSAGVHIGADSRARGALGAAAGALAEEPHDEARAARVLEQAARVGQAGGDVAAIAAPVLGPEGEAVLECVVHGFREPPAEAQVAAVAAALRHTCAVIARRARDADHPLGSA